MKKYAIIFLTVACSAILASENRLKSEIDWKTGTITSEAVYSIKSDETGLPVDYSDSNSSGINKARLEAYEQSGKLSRELITKELKNLQIDSTTTFEDLLKESEYSRRMAAELIQNKIKTRKVPYNFSSAKCISSLKISDIIAALPLDFPDYDFPDFGTGIIPTDYTSVVIDVRGLGITPMIFPSIYSEDGIEIYGRTLITPGKIDSSGPVSFCFNETEALKHKKAGIHPFYTVALKNLRNSPVIANEDVDRILCSKVTRSNIKSCKVIFIIDRINK
ncbi:MAG: hypothetical protein JW982_08970 [Spirochaetes bacterium]|nr:hypothetical protein [Spirochaetota bacterium]